MKLLHGDANEILDILIESGVKVDAIITDPPYELHTRGGSPHATELGRRATMHRDSIKFLSNGFDYDSIFDKFLKLCKIPNILIFCSNLQISKIMSWFENKQCSVTLLVWKKPQAIPLANRKYISDLEFIVYVRKSGVPWNTDVKDYKRKCKLKICNPVFPRDGKIHVTQKPVELLEELVELHSLQNHLILDPFMGSGSVGIACANLKRNFIGIEISKEFYDLTLTRITTHLKNIQPIGERQENTECQKNGSMAKSDQE